MNSNQPFVGQRMESCSDRRARGLESDREFTFWGKSLARTESTRDDQLSNGIRNYGAWVALMAELCRNDTQRGTDAVCVGRWHIQPERSLRRRGSSSPMRGRS
jgi:hypothetical protein